MDKSDAKFTLPRSSEVIPLLYKNRRWYINVIQILVLLTPFIIVYEYYFKLLRSISDLSGDAWQTGNAVDYMALLNALWDNRLELQLALALATLFVLGFNVLQHNLATRFSANSLIFFEIAENLYLANFRNPEIGKELKKVPAQASEESLVYPTEKEGRYFKISAGKLLGLSYQRDIDVYRIDRILSRKFMDDYWLLQCEMIRIKNEKQRAARKHKFYIDSRYYKENYPWFIEKLKTLGFPKEKAETLE